MHFGNSIIFLGFLEGTTGGEHIYRMRHDWLCCPWRRPSSWWYGQRSSGEFALLKKKCMWKVLWQLILDCAISVLPLQITVASLHECECPMLSSYQICIYLLGCMPYITVSIETFHMFIFYKRIQRSYMALLPLGLCVQVFRQLIWFLNVPPFTYPSVFFCVWQLVGNVHVCINTESYCLRKMYVPFW